MKPTEEEPTSLYRPPSRRNRLSRRFVALGLLMGLAAQAIERPRLVADLAPDPGARSSYPAGMHRLGNRIVLTATDPLHGNELRSVSEDLGETTLLVDATPGTSGSTVLFLAEFDGALAFLVGTPPHYELYVTDGTRDGTRLVRDGDGSALMIFGWLYAAPAVAVAGERLIFAGRSVTGFTHGLWAVEASGAAALLRTVPEPEPYFLERRFEAFRTVGENVFFQEVVDYSRGRIWMTDGTVDGTRLVSEAVEGDTSRSAASEQSYFFASFGSGAQSLYSLNVDSGEVMLLRTWEAYFWEDLELYSGGSSRVYFRAPSDSGTGLWVTDGTPEGTIEVRFDRSPYWTESFAYVWFGDAFVFETLGGDEVPVLWEHDALEPSAQLLRMPPPDSRPWRGPPTLLGDLLFFFVAGEGTSGHQLWRTDGTTAGTFQVSQFPVGQGGIGTGSGFDAGGIAVFVLDHYCTSIPPHCSWRNYVSDGSVEGSGLVEGDLEPWTAAAVPAGVLVPGCIEGCPTGLELALIDREDRSVRVAANFEPEIGATTFKRLLAREGELYLSTGTWWSEPLSWFLPSPLQEPIALPAYGEETPAVLENLAGTIVANASFGNQLFTWDPNAASWHPLPLSYEVYGEEPVKVVTRGGRAYLRESEISQVVWETNGTDEGTRARIAPGLPHYAEIVAASGSHLFFRERSYFSSWWSLRLSDDTLIPLFEETGPQFYRQELEAVTTASHLYFTTPEFGSLELLRHSDGTPAGTGITWTSAANERVLDLFPVGDALYFLVAADRLSLWSAVDGGPASRVAELGTLAADPDDERRRGFLPVDGGFYFFAETLEHGAELWFTDGTQGGTRVADVVPGPIGSEAREIAAVGGLVFFSAEDRIFGRELWAVPVGGTEATRVTDIGPGPVGSVPEHLTAAGSSLYFDADDGVHGRELWQIDTAGGIGGCEPTATRLCLLQGRFEVEAVWRGFAGESRLATAVAQSEESGFFTFADPKGVELAVKVIDACGAPEFRNFWFFAAGLTNLEATLSVLDTVSFERRTYSSSLGAPFAPIRDTAHFSTCGSSPVESSFAAPAFAPPIAKGDAGCEDGGETLCLQEGRFEVTLDWAAASGPPNAARAQALSAETGTFTFFDAGTVEAVVRLIDGCSFNDRYWLFAGGLTDVATRLRVRDVLHPERDLVFEKPSGEPFAPILDLAAFAGCP